MYEKAIPLTNSCLFVKGNEYRAGHALQRQGEEADEADEVWRLLDPTGK